MQTPLAPAQQANEIARFVRDCGGNPEHQKVLELVARLHGAATWDAMEARHQEEAGAIATNNQAEAAGEREVDILTSHVLFIGAAMFEDEPWYLMRNKDGVLDFERQREITAEELALLELQGVVVEALVRHPRTSHWGLPDVALLDGMLHWLHVEQGFATCRAGSFGLFSEDTGDDSSTSCVLTVRLPNRFHLS